MIALHDIAYVRLGTRDLEGASRYAREVLGLRDSPRDTCDPAGRSAGFRSDAREQTLLYVEGDPADHVTGFEVVSVDAMEAAAAELERLGHAVRAGTADECEARRVKAFVAFRDPTGNAIELAVAPFHGGVRFFPSRDTGNTGFSHVGLRTTDPVRDERFWTTVLGAKVSDRIGAAPLLRIDEVHHKIALFPSAHAGVQHVNHQVESVDDLMRAWYFMRAHGVRVVFGPGRHPTSGAMFLYFEGPDGMVFEFSCGVRRVTDPDAQPRQFPFHPSSFCLWGSVPDIPEFR